MQLCSTPFSGRQPAPPRPERQPSNQTHQGCWDFGGQRAAWVLQTCQQARHATGDIFAFLWQDFFGGQSAMAHQRGNADISALSGLGDFVSINWLIRHACGRPPMGTVLSQRRGLALADRIGRAGPRSQAPPTERGTLAPRLAQTGSSWSRLRLGHLPSGLPSRAPPHEGPCLSSSWFRTHAHRSRRPGPMQTEIGGGQRRPPPLHRGRAVSGLLSWAGLPIAHPAPPRLGLALGAPPLEGVRRMLLLSRRGALLREASNTTSTATRTTPISGLEPAASSFPLVVSCAPCRASWPSLGSLL